MAPELLVEATRCRHELPGKLPQLGHGRFACTALVRQVGALTSQEPPSEAS
jgi:hypothetical protein